MVVLLLKKYLTLKLVRKTLEEDIISIQALQWEIRINIKTHFHTDENHMDENHPV